MTQQQLFARKDSAEERVTAWVARRLVGHSSPALLVVCRAPTGRAAFWAVAYGYAWRGCAVVLDQFESPLLTADEVASILRTSRRVIYEMARCGRLPGVTRIGRRILFRRDRLVQFLRERESSVSSLGDPS